MQIEWKDVTIWEEDFKLDDDFDNYVYEAVFVWKCHWDIENIWLEDLLLDMLDNINDMIDNWQDYTDSRFYQMDWALYDKYSKPWNCFNENTIKKRLEAQIDLLNSKNEVARIKRAVAEAIGLEE